MADVKIDEAKARQWVAKVQAELAATEKELEAVRNIRSSMPGKDDTLFELISKVSEKMDAVWTNTCRKFKEGWELLQENLKVFAKAGGTITTTATGVGNTIGQ